MARLPRDDKGVGRGEDGITSPQTGLERCKRGTGSEWQRPITYS